MLKEDICNILKRIKIGQSVRFQFDLGTVDGKLFRDSKMGTVMVYAEQLPSIDLNFNQYKDEDDIPWVIAMWDNFVGPDGFPVN